MIYQEAGYKNGIYRITKKASIKYISEKTDDIRLRVPKGLKEKYRMEAEKRGTSMTQFIISAIDGKIKREDASNE